MPSSSPRYPPIRFSGVEDQGPGVRRGRWLGVRAHVDGARRVHFALFFSEVALSTRGFGSGASTHSAALGYGAMPDGTASGAATGNMYAARVDSKPDRPRYVPPSPSYEGGPKPLPGNLALRALSLSYSRSHPPSLLSVPNATPQTLGLNKMWCLWRSESGLSGCSTRRLVHG
eukprot:3932333-Rhodomonas_salina.3